jgi:hypothetical protein
MTIHFADVPVADASLARTRTQPRPTRRALIQGGFGLATAAALGTLQSVNATVARAAYFNDWTNTAAGPCAPEPAEGNYAVNHSEDGLKCGPSLMCSACCWAAASSGVNKLGWHRNGQSGATEYWWRPDACWAGTYDSWRWKWSTNTVYRCSDGWRFNSSGTVKTICPYAV